MEELLDAADEWLSRAQQQQPMDPPDFPIPAAYQTIPTNEYVTLRDTGPLNAGMGWFANRDLPAGTLLMVCKPFAMVMDWQDDSDENMQEEDEDEGVDDEKEPRLNELLLLQILAKLKDHPAMWNDLNQLFPRTDQDLATLPAWVCEDDAVFCQIEAHLQALPLPQSTVKDISKRLPLILRYNILAVETCGELLSYPATMNELGGVALYHQPSFFNHSARPNCSRWAVGDVMGFVTNQNIAAGTQVCISYLEHDVLCESPHRRTAMLRMNFTDDVNHNAGNHNNGNSSEQGGPDLPVVDSNVQNELMGMHPFERLSAIDDLIQQAIGAKSAEEETEVSVWFQCDVQNLRIIKAITLDGIGQSRAALQLWEESIVFTETQLPPSDEASVVVRVHAALCAWHVGEADRAKEHAARALHTHNLIFGGGVARFRRRYKAELQLTIRSGKPALTEPAVDSLWPINM